MVHKQLHGFSFHHAVVNHLIPKIWSIQVMEITEKKTRRIKKPYSSITYTTGDPDLNIAFFNKCMGTDKIDDGEASSKDTTAETSGDGASASVDGGIGLAEAKRDVRRYYIRPQNIFCSNKDEVLRALIDIGTNNCSIYTLKNIADNDDVHKLTNKDIIYYYDDGILYDKNKVRIMDYDLYIRHEEERKKFSGDPDKVSDAEFNKEYSDRITDRDTDKEVKESLNESWTKEELEKRLSTATEADAVYLGYEVERDNIAPLGGDQYASTEYLCWKDGEEYILEALYTFHHGGEREAYTKIFDSIDDLYTFIAPKKFEEGYTQSKKPLEENAFNCEFIGVNAFNEAVVPKFTCCICGEEVEGYGNNPWPYKETGTCCDACNRKFVLPMRLAEYQAEYDLDGKEKEGYKEESLKEPVKHEPRQPKADFETYKCFK